MRYVPDKPEVELRIDDLPISAAAMPEDTSLAATDGSYSPSWGY
jgi:hypothetical protein